jgi:type VI protein secretion system component Hcp
VAYDAYLKLGKVEGESTNSQYDKWIELDSWSWGASRVSTAVGAPAPLDIQSFSFTARVGQHSAELLELLVERPFGTAGTLAVVKEGVTGAKLVPAVQFKFTDVLLSVYDIGESSDVVPQEQVSFVFQQLTMTTGVNSVEVGTLPG